RAHLGVLFLDEAPEFSPRVLETLRQPLELGEVVIHRSAGAARYPARFQLVLAANPCPCGRATGKGLDCVCTPLAKRRYLGRLSGPLLDRIDISVEVGQVRALDVQGGSARESSAEVGARVARAREAQRARLEGAGWRLNSEVPGTWLRRRLGTTSGVVRELNRVLDQRLLSLRGVDRVLRVAWTVADLAGREAPGMDELDTAMALRGRGAA
ncbi:MAG: ATP-binding protein, partial [Bifidobacteriaceae bacterium]|nr:ATP-binding protein [Bifidobacteriaceae bacterium]